MTTTEDTYRVRVWSRRRHVIGPVTFGPLGWTVDVDYLGAWDERGDQGLLIPRQLWFRTRAEAVEFGVDVARGEHKDYGADADPLVIHVGPNIVVDERPGVDAR